MKASIQGIQGEICLPQCDGSQNCPAPPSGVQANSMCLLKDPSKFLFFFLYFSE